MGARFLAFAAFVFLGFTFMSSARQAPELYVSSLAPVSSRAATEMPSAILMTEMSPVPAPPRQPDSSYDWRMNQKDWRFQLLSMIPFGLLFIAVSLQNTKRAEEETAEECEITAISGVVPPEYCRQMVAMASVDGQRPVLPPLPRDM